MAVKLFSVSIQKPTSASRRPPAGRGILGVVDGARPKGIETEPDVAARESLLRQLG
jgi:adenosine/AMP kinase